MHEHDTNLIMALAEGALDPSAAAATEADLASCEVCRTDLELQRVALRALSSTPRAEMNDIERARVRRTVRDELGLVVPRPAVTARTGDLRRYRLFAGLAGAAAVLVAVVVVGPRLDLLGGDDAGAGDDSFEVAFAPETTMTAGGAQEAPSAAVTEDRIALDRGGDGAGDMATDGSEENAAATTAPPTTAAPSVPSSMLDSLTLYSTQELQVLPTLSEVAASITQARSLSAFGPPGEGNARLDVLDEARCIQIGLDQAPDSAEAFILALAGIDDVEVVIVAYVAPDFEIVTVLAHDLETCEILASSSP